MPYGIMGSPEQSARPAWTYQQSGILNWNQRVKKEEEKLVICAAKDTPVETILQRQKGAETERPWYTERQKTEYPGSIEQEFVSRNFHVLQPLLGLSPDKKRPGGLGTTMSPTRFPAKGSLTAREHSRGSSTPRYRSENKSRNTADLSPGSPQRLRTPRTTLTPRIRTGDVGLQTAVDFGEYFPFESRIRQDIRHSEDNASSKVPKLKLDESTLRNGTSKPSSSRLSSRSSASSGYQRVRALQEAVLQEREKREAAELKLFETMREMADDDRGKSFQRLRPDLYPTTVQGSGLEDLPVGTKIWDMFRPPTQDIEKTWREGVPSLGLDNSLWHNTTEALGTTHNTHRGRRFLPSRQLF